ncbi:MAG: hypothetical protein JWO79_2976 [Actinomycetia bacterium]|jgi:uncharacterized Zn-binding protein involved in type VI secretion|nr:hypothetical protein [Actinomycetes bacterium]MDQ1654375.1 hypothetical protein [Cryptosporangiaceae bacterium]MDQ1657552.1 hypothetical protein [Cryptosporangiaceae bacterium]
MPPAAVLNDKIQAQCAIHLIPNPATGAPQPSPAPMPFSAPVTMGVCTSVLIGNKAAVVVGSQGMCTPPHVGLHPSDPYMVPATELGAVTQGSTSVLFGGQPAARSGDPCTACGMPGATLMGTASDVMIGG